MTSTSIGMLLIEPQFVMRRTICAVAGQLRLAEVHEAPSFSAAEARLKEADVSAVLASFDDFDSGSAFVRRLRAGELGCRVDIPVAVMMTHCLTPQIILLSSFDIRRIVIKPFKVRTILETVGALAEMCKAPTGAAWAA